MLERKRQRLYNEASKKMNGLMCGSSEYIYWIDYKMGLHQKYAEINDNVLPYEFMASPGFMDGYNAMAKSKPGAKKTQSRQVHVKMSPVLLEEIITACMELQIDKSKFIRKSIEDKLKKWREHGKNTINPTLQNVETKGCSGT